MKAAIYACSVKADQEDIESQLQICKSKAAEKGIEVVAEYVDVNKEQPELQRLMDESGGFEYVVVTKPGILSLHFNRYGVLANSLADLGVHIAVAVRPENGGLFSLARSAAPIIIDDMPQAS